MAKNWNKQIQKAEKFLDKTWERGKKVYDRYEDVREGADSFVKKVNVFYANVNTLKESLFNSLPKADVSKIQKGDYSDEASRVACVIAKRVLDYEIQCAPSFRESMELATIDRLVPGIGQVWLTFDMDMDEEGEPIQGTEHIGIETVHWCDFIFEPARRWSKVSWAGRKLHYTRDEFIEEFGEEKLLESGGAPDENSSNSWKPEDVDKDKICVYEIWDKKEKKVYFIKKGMEEPLAEKDDPYKLKNFFPCPRPLIANVNGNKFLPYCDYYMSQDQYNQLDVLYARMSLIIEAVKVAGMYNSEYGNELKNMLEGPQNKMIPCDNWAMMAEKGGIKGNIDWYPVEQVVGVLTTLQAQFEAIKGLLAEISGMSDIVRGDSNQYETAKAQQIKAQFASVRLNGYQRDVSIFFGEVITIMADLAFGLYSDEKIMTIVGELQETDLEALPAASEILRSDLMRMYKIQIAPDSLTQADWAMEKEQRQQIVQVLGAMIGQIVPMIQQVPELSTLGVQMIKFAISGYKGAYELEGWIDRVLDGMLRQQMEAQKNPQPKEPSPEEQKAQAEIEKIKLEAQTKQQQSAADLQMEQQKLEFERQKNDMELAHKQAMFALESQMKQMELQFRQKEAMMKATTSAISSAQGLEQQKAKGELTLEQQAQKDKYNDSRENKKGEE
jgi:hypothetical protein